MEFYSYHDGLGKWVEVGNSGVFRPEMLRPMGFDEDVTVIAWGMSLERPTMIKCALNEPRARALRADGVHGADTALPFHLRSVIRAGTACRTSATSSATRSTST